MAGPIDPRLLRRGRATSSFLAALAVVGVASSALVIAQARLISTHVAHVFATHRLDGVAGGAALLLLVFCARAVLAWLNEVLAHQASAQVKSTLRHDIMAARLARPSNPQLSTGALLRLVTTGLDDLDGYYSKYLPQLVLAMVVPLVVGITICLHDLTSAIIIAVTIPLIPVFMALIGLATRDQVNRRLAVSTRLANHFADLVTGLPTLQVFSRARNQVIGLRKTEESHRRETMATLRITFMSSFALELLSTISVALVAVTVGLRVLYGHMDLRNALFVLVLAPEAYLPVRQVGVHYHDAADGVAAAEAALDIIDDADEHAAHGVLPVPTDTTLRFDDVSFRHDGAASDALSHLDLVVRPGEVVALAGPSGGGKSTALAIAAGLLPPTSGRALVGDVPVRDLDQAEWHRALAWVGQAPGMLRDTIAVNAALGCPPASETAVAAALRDAGAAELDPAWLVGDDAEGLSGGERRRIGVARALLRLRQTSVRLLLLDEPTAGLDSDTEAIVLHAVREAGIAALVVSHRPAVLQMVDRVVQVGAHEPVASSGPHGGLA